MVFNYELRIKHLQQPVQSRRCSAVESETTVANEFGKGDVLKAYPPLIKPHGHAHQFHCPIRHQRNPSNVHELLLMVCIGRQKRVGVLCQMMLAMEFPKWACGVHEAVVPVEPEINSYTVHADLEWQPLPLQGVWCFIGLVCEIDRHDHSKCGGGHKFLHDFADADIWDLVSRVFVAIEKAIHLAKSSHNVHFVDSVQFEGRRVKSERSEEIEVISGVCCINVMEG